MIQGGRRTLPKPIQRCTGRVEECAYDLAITLEPAPIETDPQGVVRVAKTRITLDTVVSGDCFF